MSIGVNAKHNESQRVTGFEQADFGLTKHLRSTTRQLGGRSFERTELRHLLVLECLLLGLPDFLQ